MSSMSYDTFAGRSQPFLAGSAEKEKPSPDASNPRTSVIVVGMCLLTLLSFAPIWNAWTLMEDPNYTFWFGLAVPRWMLFGCIAIIVLYAFTAAMYFNRPRPQMQTEYAIMLTASIFIVVLGMLLYFCSLPLSREAAQSYSDVMYRCDSSEQTQRLYEYSQVLHNIRSMPGCAKKFSVEECEGYEDAEPYTGFLKMMESKFRCSGFCYRPPAYTPVQAGVFPPTLFSDTNYQASCEGMAARAMKTLSGDVGFTTFYQGIYMLIIAFAVTFAKLVGLCVGRLEVPEDPDTVQIIFKP